MSAKTSNQPGRRTPLSLSGSITKGGHSHNTKGGGSTAANNNSNGHSNNLKQDNKNQQHNKTEQQTTNAQKQQQQQQQQAADAKEPPATKLQNKQAVAGATTTTADSKIPKLQQQLNSDHTKSQKQGIQNEKKQQLAAEKQQQQNGVSDNHKISGNQQQQPTNIKEKQQNDETDVKSNEKDNKKEKLENASEKHENEDKEKEKSEKDEKKHKNDKKKQELKKQDGGENKKEDKVENKKKDKVENKKEEDKVEIEEKKEENSETDEKPANVTEVAGSIKKDNEKKKKETDVVQMDIVEEVAAQPQEPQQKLDNAKSAPSTPKSLKESKPPTPNKLTPSKNEKTPQKCIPTKREVTTCIDDFEMEPLNVESSPDKPEQKEKNATGLAPCATSTPGKIVLSKAALPKTDIQLALQPSVTPERPRAFSQISGRRAIRPTTEYTPSKFQSNLQFRESYRRINTELDATNTSLNVTVGSEVPNNASFSFFGRGRKRDRTPPQHSQFAIGELLQTTEMEISPPKRARLDFFSVVSSPLSLLRNRFSKASLQSSTPVKLQQKLEEKEDDIEVQNVSGVSVHEDIEKSTSEYVGDDSFAEEANAENNTPTEGELELLDNGDKELSLKSSSDRQQTPEDGDIKITETPLQSVTGDPTGKNKRCIVM